MSTGTISAWNTLLMPSSSTVVFSGVVSGVGPWTNYTWEPDPEPKRKLPDPYQLVLDSDLFHLTTQEIQKKFKFNLTLDVERAAEKEFYTNLQKWRERNNKTNPFEGYGTFSTLTYTVSA